MSFSLSNIPTTFQKYIDKIMANKLNIFILIYLDDLFIYIKDSSQLYIKAIYWILDQL